MSASLPLFAGYVSSTASGGVCRVVVRRHFATGVASFHSLLPYISRSFGRSPHFSF